MAAKLLWFFRKGSIARQARGDQPSAESSDTPAGEPHRTQHLHWTGEMQTSPPLKAVQLNSAETAQNVHWDPKSLSSYSAAEAQAETAHSPGPGSCKFPGIPQGAVLVWPISVRTPSEDPHNEVLWKQQSTQPQYQTQRKRVPQGKKWHTPLLQTQMQNI